MTIDKGLIIYSIDCLNRTYKPDIIRAYFYHMQKGSPYIPGRWYC